MLFTKLLTKKFKSKLPYSGGRNNTGIITVRGRVVYLKKLII